jgi:phage FluMu protein Com
MEEDRAMDDVLDGNAVGGRLATLFGSDVTAVPGRCAHCHRVNMVGALRAYLRAPGAVLRCPHCDGVVIRIVETTEATYLDLSGVSYLRFERR